MFESFLFTIDMTGIPVTMNLFGREKVKTRFGGICSILFLGYVMWAVYNSAYELLTTINPKIVSYEYFKDDPRAIILNRETFPVGFAMQAPAMLNYRTYKDSGIFTIRMTHQRMERTHTENGGTIENWTISKIYTENCPRDYFGAQASSLGDMNLKSMYCIAKEQPELDKLEIQGVFSSSVYEAIVVEVVMCDNSTSNGTCAPPEKIDEYLSGGWFNMVYVNMVVNPQNYTSPNNTYKDIYYTMVDPDNYRETEVNLGYVEINTDRGWFTESFNTKTYTKLEKIVEYLNTDPRPDKVLIQCSLKVSQLETYYTRSYKKVQGVLAEAGGMINLGLAIMVLVVTPFMRVKFREALMNELFDVRLPQNKSQTKKRKRDSCQPEKPKEGHPPRKYNAKQTDKITLANLKNTFMTNLSSTEDFLKSPNSPEKRKDPSYNKKSFLVSPQQSFSSTLHSPTLQEKKEYSDLESPPKRANVKVFRYSKTFNEIENEKPIDQGYSRVIKETLSYEDQTAKIRETKVKSEKRNSKSPLVTQNKPLKLKTLHEENSLHLSFPSNSDESDIESGEEKKETNKPEMTTPEQTKRNQTGNWQIENNEEIKLGERVSEFKIKIKENSKTLQKPLEKSNIGICEYISWLLYRPKSQKQTHEVFKESLKHIDERLDIINVMKKLREIDKLQALLLDPDQQILFANMPKPMAQLGNVQGRKGENVARLKSLKFVQEEVYEDQLMNSINNLRDKKEKTEIDKKLIEMFENESFC